DEYMAEFFQLVAVHLYMLAAMDVSCMSKSSSSNTTTTCLYCCSPLRWLRLADIVLILATMGDTALAYLNLWKEQVVDNGPLTQEYLLYAGMATAGCWGLSALVYVLVAMAELCCCNRRSKRSSNDYDDEVVSAKDDPEASVYSEKQHHEVYEDGGDSDDDDEESQESDRPLNKYLPQSLKQEHTEDTADDDASVTSFSSWWTAGPKSKDGIARSSLDKIFGR
ncbi:MAG: hypothetical protein SGARI_002148, partial [Bacillariaceae sp.]